VPVDIEHVDAIIDMRATSDDGVALPTERHCCFATWRTRRSVGTGLVQRTKWLDRARLRGAIIDGPIPEDIEYLYWVAVPARSTSAVANRRSPRAHAAPRGREFRHPRAARVCTGDPARRMGNEYLFPGDGKGQRRATDEVRARKSVATVPLLQHDENNIPMLGGDFEMILTRSC